MDEFATSQGSIIVNWLPFIADHQSPRFEPRILQVPLESFEAPSKLCRKLFAEALKDEYELIVKESSMKFWKPRDVVLVEDYLQALEKLSISGMNTYDFEQILAPRSFSKKLDEATLDENNLHLFVTMDVINEVPEPFGGELVVLNWLLFIADHQSPRIKPRILEVPLESFKAPSQLCGKLFAEAIKDEYKLIVKESSIEFWKSKYAVLIEDYLQAVERISTSGMNNDFEEILAPFSLSEELGEATLDENNLHLFVTAQVRQEAWHDKEQDVITGLSALQRYRNILANPGITPAEGSKATEYAHVQARKSYAIHDGRLPDTPNFPTVAPPIQIFHPIFDTFLQHIEDPSTHPNEELLILTQRFMHLLSVVGLSENERDEDIRTALTDILGLDIYEELNANQSATSGVHVYWVNKSSVRVPLLIMELRRELGDGNSDPSTHAGLTMRRSWIQADCQFIRDKCCCPTLLLAGGGPWMTILGGVFTDKIIVQRLTDLMWVGHSSTHEDGRVYRFAKVLSALRTSISQLKTYYNNIHAQKHDLQLKSHEAHPRFFPHPTSFPIHNGTKNMNFTYLCALEENVSACVTYKARTSAGSHVVVKFVSRYSGEVHEFLADKGYAPNLLYIGPLPDVPKRSPAQDVAPYGLSLGPMQMVVMEYVEASGSTPANARTQLEAVLTALHARGYVFGDLRRPNILFDEEGAVKLIDFDWAGRYDRNIQDDLDCLSEKLRQKLHISDNERQQGNYAYYPLNLSPSVDWAEGVKDLKPIRPAHDWDMLKKLKL